MARKKKLNRAEIAARLEGFEEQFAAINGELKNVGAEVRRLGGDYTQSAADADRRLDAFADGEQQMNSRLEALEQLRAEDRRELDRVKALAVAAGKAVCSQAEKRTGEEPAQPQPTVPAQPPEALEDADKSAAEPLPGKVCETRDDSSVQPVNLPPESEEPVTDLANDLANESDAVKQADAAPVFDSAAAARGIDRMLADYDARLMAAIAAGNYHADFHRAEAFADRIEACVSGGQPADESAPGAPESVAAPADEIAEIPEEQPQFQQQPASPLIGEAPVLPVESVQDYRAFPDSDGSAAADFVPSIWSVLNAAKPSAPAVKMPETADPERAEISGIPPAAAEKMPAPAVAAEETAENQEKAEPEAATPVSAGETAPLRENPPTKAEGPFSSAGLQSDPASQLSDILKVYQQRQAAEKASPKSGAEQPRRSGSIISLLNQYAKAEEEQPDSEKTAQ